MRNQNDVNGVKVQAVAGTHAVLLGWDMAADDIKRLKVLGFAIQRVRKSDGERIWLPGMKTFEATYPNPPRGVPVSSYQHPIQSFQWADYTVSPNQSYTYRIVARVGTPQTLADGPAVDVDVTTVDPDMGKHAIYFNRGAIASQEYARRFSNKPPAEAGPAAYDWLSRGLIESLEAFIAQANNGDELLGAFFEFKNTRIFDALAKAEQRGAKIKVLYDGDSEREANETAIPQNIKHLTKAREHSGQFAHNKFFVLRQNGASVRVWTGSTNLSENGIFGHSNNAHEVRTPEVAEQYFQYWKELDKDQTVKPTAAFNDAVTATPPAPWDAEVTTVFSPRSKADALDWYSDIAGGAKGALFTTFAFGMDERFVSVYRRRDDILRFALLEKKGNGRNYAKQAAQVDEIRKLPNTVIAVGHRIELNAFDRWLAEIDHVTDKENVIYVHTKYMLVDPLGKVPKVIVGSANFSVASSDKNDENMLVIQGNKDVADVYLTEFMRLFSHYAFRESLSFHRDAAAAAAAPAKYLIDNPSWIDGAPGEVDASYYAQGTDRALRRLYFSGQRTDE